MSNPPDPLTLPATLLSLFGVGVLLTADAGAGKTDLTLALLDRGHRLVSDDVVELFAREGRPWGRAPEGVAGMLAIRGIGIVDAGAWFGGDRVIEAAAIDFVIALDPAPPQADALAVARDSVTIMTSSVPRLTLPGGTGRPLALLIEAAVRAHAGGTERTADFIRAQQRRLQGS